MTLAVNDANQLSPTVSALCRPSAEIFVPDGTDVATALGRTTHLGIGAHHDDLEIMAAHGILECHGKTDRWFTGVVVTDGAGSARTGAYQHHTDEQMRAVRRAEQKQAACLGEYAAQVLLDHTSAAVKTAAAAQGVVDDLVAVIRASKPTVVYTHNLADKHDTHVAVVLRVLAACQRLPETERPHRLIGCEVWRDLDWLMDQDKEIMPVDGDAALSESLLAVFASQIAGGKRYDRATAGRRQANATYSDPRSVDQHSAVICGMDLTPLMQGGDPIAYVSAYIRRFESDVATRLSRLADT